MSDGDEATRRRTTTMVEYRKKLLQHKELEARVRTARENLRSSKKAFNKTKDDLKSLQCVGQIIGEVLRPLDNERCSSIGYGSSSANVMNGVSSGIVKLKNCKFF